MAKIKSNSKEKLEKILGKNEVEISYLNRIKVQKEVADALEVFKNNKQALGVIVEESLKEYGIKELAKEYLNSTKKDSDGNNIEETKTEV